MAIVAIYQPAGEPLAIVSARPLDMTVAKAQRAVPTGLPFKLVDESEYPTDETFRAAWEWDGDLVTDNDGVGV